MSSEAASSEIEAELSFAALHRSASSTGTSPLQRALVDIAAGTVGGIGLVAVGYPTDTVKVRLQTQPFNNPVYSGTIDCIRKIYRREGVVGFYRGFESPLAGQMVFNAVQFLAYSVAKDTVAQLNDDCEPASPDDRFDVTKYKTGSPPLTIPQYWLAGALVGILVSVIETPMDLFKCQLQTQTFVKASERKYSTFVGAVKYITQHYGLRGWYQGGVSTVLRNIPSVGNYFAVFEAGKAAQAHYTHKRVDQLSPLQLLGAGWLAGMGYWLVTYPIDSVKSAIQSGPADPRQRQHQRFIETASYLLKHEGGVRRLFKGYGLCVLRAGPSNAVCLSLYELTSKFLNRHLTEQR